MDQSPDELLRTYLQTLGLDADDDPELRDTPRRVTEMFKELFAGLTSDPPVPSTFPTPGGAPGDPVVVAAISFQSMCVHHLVPFFGFVDVAYIPAEQTVGFGSIGRIVDHFARRPQVQERMIAQIADYLESTLQPDGLLVRLRARQMCMEMRGAKKSGELISLIGRGSLTEGSQRTELLSQFEQCQKTL